MGRPREFDIDRAVDTAMGLFWRQGYAKTSLTDLTHALKITPPSFYFAFGSKEKLFKKALDRYMDTQFAYFDQALCQPTSRGVATFLLKSFAEAYTDPAHPGCLCVNSSSPCSASDDPIRKEIGKWRSSVHGKLSKRFKLAKAQKDLPADADPDDLADYLLIVGTGMALAAQSGASRKDLLCTVTTALNAWPT
jgi:AcrR family transcriptional regulator